MERTSDDFFDVKKEVPFISSVETSLSRLTPTFTRLEELYISMEAAKKKLAAADALKNRLHFRRAAMTRKLA